MRKQVVKSAITSAAIFRCTAKCTFTEKGTTIQAGRSFYRVNSDTVNDSYIIHWNGHELICNCPARCECKHLRGVQEVMAERKQYQKQQVTPAATLAGYDVVGASLNVLNQALIDAKIGTFYEDVVTRQEPEVLWSEVCRHRVKSDVHSHCGCMA